jgi:serine/threonine protein kinase
VHKILDAPLVLKVPNDDLQADPEYPKFVERFLKEGKILWNLSQERHSHIVRITDLFEERGLPWLVMDYIQGESLFDRVRRKGALPEGEVVSFIQQIGGALGVVHRVKLVHRDAHPGNIMILPPNPKKKQREAMLIDFGIAGEMFPSTVSSKFFGNPAFAPYEQFGSPAHPKMDVYTLAASCYFALTGTLPESAMNRKLYDRKLFPPKHHRSSLSQSLNDVVMWGMTLEAAQRPSLDEWLNRLAGSPMQFSPHRSRLDHWIKQVIQPIVTTPTVDARDLMRPLQPIPLQPNCFNLTNKGKKLELIAVPAGTLMMEGGHRVNLKPFLIGKYPITQQQYQAVMGQNPSSFKSNLDCPVECVRWHDAINFCKKLSRILKQNIDLPSETQWEWAARGAMESKGYTWLTDKTNLRHRHMCVF